MLEELQIYSLTGFVAGVCFIIGSFSCVFLLTRILPRKYFDPTGIREEARSRREIAFRQLSIACFKRNEHKVYVKVSNPTKEVFERVMFRLSVRNAQGELIDEAISIANVVFGSESITEALLSICDDNERKNILCNDLALNVEILRESQV